jgi:hypothetical protein
MNCEQDFWERATRIFGVANRIWGYLLVIDKTVFYFKEAVTSEERGQSEWRSSKRILLLLGNSSKILKLRLIMKRLRPGEIKKEAATSRERVEREQSSRETRN